MTTVTIEEAKARLSELIGQLASGDAGIVIVKGGDPVAQLVPPPKSATNLPRFGFWKDKLKIVAEDDDHLIDFREYMP